jgi:hypothetical protein
MSPLITIIDIETNKTIKRDFTEQELKQYETDKEITNLKIQAAKEKQSLIKSANAKLAGLGLTPEEIAAITS